MSAMDFSLPDVTEFPAISSILEMQSFPLDSATIGNYTMQQIQDGANASMTVFSMVETAKANGLDPQMYLQYLLDKRPSAEMSDTELEKFLPWSSEAKSACSKNIE